MLTLTGALGIWKEILFGAAGSGVNSSSTGWLFT